jgi:hypothetical protein
MRLRFKDKDNYALVLGGINQCGETEKGRQLEEWQLMNM